MELNPRQEYLALNLKWKIENYTHEISLNVTNPEYIITDLHYKSTKLQTPEFLYKFYSHKDYNFESLENPYLYFGNPADFNDSFDSVLSEDPYIKTFLDESLINNIGICNFSTKTTNLMWSYYTEKHQGFAVKFKNNKLFLPNREIVPIRSHILYLKNNIPDHPNLIETLKSLSDKHFPEVINLWQHQVLMQHDLCRKNTTYNWESEYRMITFEREKYNRRIELNPLTIDSIFIGHKMSSENLKRMHSILKNMPHVKVFKINPNPKNQILEKIRVKDINNLISD